MQMHFMVTGQEGYCVVMAEDITEQWQNTQKRIEQANHNLRLTLNKEEQFRQATISDSVVVANINVTKNMIEDEMYEQVCQEMQLDGAEFATLDSLRFC